MNKIDTEKILCCQEEWRKKNAPTLVEFIDQAVSEIQQLLEEEAFSKGKTARSYFISDEKLCGIDFGSLYPDDKRIEIAKRLSKVDGLRVEYHLDTNEFWVGLKIF